MNSTSWSVLRNCLLVTMVLSALSIRSISAAPVSMAVMGDSINLLTPTYDTSWVVQLQNAGAITQHDVARDGATSNGVVSGQLPTIVSLAQQGQITDSVLVVGANDFGPFGPNAQTVFLGGNAQPVIDTFVSNVEKVITSIAAANPGVHQVIANIPDITATPLAPVLALAYGATPAEIQAGRNAIITANNEIQQFALAHGVPVIDLFKAADVLVPLYPWTFGGHTFSTMFASNQFDILTQPEGLISNMIATAFNEVFGQNLPIFSDQQIVTNSGFTPSGPTTFYNVSQFVITPEPATWILAALGGLFALFWGVHPGALAALSTQSNAI
ncbi:MAG TPA: SGNH/GDSL hydrolase family protein [Pirellulales bacterium]|nr:SGNH/GDSL hydrolase family protein [Pirellulales bacterium]